MEFAIREKLLHRKRVGTRRGVREHNAMLELARHCVGMRMDGDRFELDLFQALDGYADRHLIGADVVEVEPGGELLVVEPCHERSFLARYVDRHGAAAFAWLVLRWLSAGGDRNEQIGSMAGDFL